MIDPRHVRRCVADAIDGEQSAADAVDRLAPMLTAETPTDDVTSGLERLVAAYPSIAETVVEAMAVTVQSGLEPPDRVIYNSTVESMHRAAVLAPDTAETVLDALLDPEIGQHLLADDLTFGRTLVSVAGDRPEIVADRADRIVLNAGADNPIPLVAADWALVRSHRRRPDRLESRVSELVTKIEPQSDRIVSEDRTGDSAAESIEAIGKIGRAVPSAVADAVPTLAERLGSGSAPERAAAAEALGLIGGRYGTWTPQGRAAPALVASALDPLWDVLDHPEPAVRTSAVETLARIRRESPESAEISEGISLSDPAIAALLRDDEQDVRTATLTALERAFDWEHGQGDGGNGVVLTDDRLVAAAAASFDDGTEACRRGVLDLFGAIGADVWAVPDGRKTLFEGLSDSSETVRRSAAEALGRIVEPTAPDAERAIDALLAATDAEDERLQTEAIEALGTIGRPTKRVVETLFDAIDGTRTTDEAVAAIVGLDDDTALGRAVVRLVAGLTDEVESESVEFESEPSEPNGSSNEASKEGSQYAEGLAIVADADPTLVGPHLGRVLRSTISAAAGTDDSQSARHVAEIVEAVADRSPSQITDAVDPILDRLVSERHAAECDDESGSERLVAALLYALAVSGTIETVGESEASALEPWFEKLHPNSRITTVASAVMADRRSGLDVLGALTAYGRQQDHDGEFHNGAAALGGFVLADAVYRQPARDGLVATLTAEDGWLRRDGGRELRELVGVDSAERERLIGPLTDRIIDEDRYVLRYAAETLAASDDPRATAMLDELSEHPRTDVRDAVETVRSGTAVEGDDRSGVDESDWSTVDPIRPPVDCGDDDSSAVEHPTVEFVRNGGAVGSSDTSEPSAPSAQEAGDEGPESASDRIDSGVLSLLLDALAHPEEPVRRRAGVVLSEWSDGESEDKHPAVVPVAWLDDSDPVRRALAAYAIGAVVDATVEPAVDPTVDPSEAPEQLSADGLDRIVGSLVETLDDTEPVVRQWAARSLGTVGERWPRAVAGAVGPLAEVTAADERVWTRLAAADALARLAVRDPSALTASADAELIGERLLVGVSSEQDELRDRSLTALQSLPAGAIGEISGSIETLLDVADEAELSTTWNALLVVAAVAGERPDAVRPQLDRLVEDWAGAKYGRHAIARLAAAFPKSVAAFEDVLADDGTDPVVRRALARCQSDEYPELLADAVEECPERLDDERSDLVEYVLHADGRDHREAVVETLRRVTASDPGRVGDVLAALAAHIDAEPSAVRRRAIEMVRALVEDECVVRAAPVSVAELVSVLRPRIEDDEWEVRSEAIRALSALRSTTTEADGFGADGVKADSVGTDDVAADCVEGRSETFDDDAIIGALVDRLGDESSWVRRHAAEYLGECAPKRLRETQTLDAVLARAEREDESLYCRRGGLFALGPVGAQLVSETRDGVCLDRIRSSLLAALDHDDVWMRRNAIETITTLARSGVIESVGESSRIADRVAERLDDPNPMVRAAACRCLGALASERYRDAVRCRADDSFEPVREAAEAAISELNREAGWIWEAEERTEDGSP